MNLTGASLGLLLIKTTDSNLDADKQAPLGFALSTSGGTADLLGVPVVRPEYTETTALGAAYLAGLGSGFWESDAEVEGNWRVGRCFEPGAGRADALERRGAWQRAVERSRNWA